MSGERVADPGEWYWAYREQVARIPRDFGYVAADPLTGKPVPFDGHRPGADGEPGTLLHAVCPEWASGLSPDEEPGAGSVRVVSFLLDLAERQIRASGGRAIEWHAATAGTAAAVGRVLRENGLAGQITVVRTAGPAGAAIGDLEPAEETSPPSAGVYWGDRREDVDQCASRFLRMMKGFAAAGLPGPLRWHAAVTGREHPVPLVMDSHAVAQLLLAGGQYTNETGELVPELGYRLNIAVIGDRPAALTIRCGVSAAQPGLVNSVVLTLAPGERARADWGGWPGAVLRWLTEAWEPDRQHATTGLAAGESPGDARGGQPGRNGPAREGRSGRPSRDRPVQTDRLWRDEQYRRQIAGAGSGGGHVVNGIRYDGWDPGANLLLGAIPPASALVMAAGYPHARLAMRHALLLRARREAWASPGCRVEWHVAEPAAVHPVQRLLARAGLAKRFVVRYTQPQDRPPITREAARADRPCLAARWGDRKEDAAQGAARLRTMLAALERLFLWTRGGWQAAISPTVGTTPVVDDPAAARQLLLMGQAFRDEPGEVIGELGFAVTGRGGHGDEQLSFQVCCGVHAGNPEWRNSVVLEVPSFVAAGGEAAGQAEELVRAIEHAWEPERAWMEDAAGVIHCDLDPGAPAAVPRSTTLPPQQAPDEQPPPLPQDPLNDNRFKK